jgi:hypothetical protein
MATHPDRSVDSDRFQYSVRALLVVVTATCVLLGFLQWVLPNDVSIGFRIGFAVMIAALIAYAVRVVNHGKRHPWKTPEDFVIVKVDAKWRRRVKSPYIMGPIAALTGVSVSFATFFLFRCGQAEEFGVFEWIAVPSSFLIIYLVPGFYMSLASEVMSELLKPEVPEVKVEGRIVEAAAGTT